MTCQVSSAITAAAKGLSQDLEAESSTGAAEAVGDCSPGCCEPGKATRHSPVSGWRGRGERGGRGEIVRSHILINQVSVFTYEVKEAVFVVLLEGRGAAERNGWWCESSVCSRSGLARTKFPRLRLLFARAQLNTVRMCMLHSVLCCELVST